jgi:hypothetical protein
LLALATLLAVAALLAVTALLSLPGVLALLPLARPLATRARLPLLLGLTTMLRLTDVLLRILVELGLTILAAESVLVALIVGRRQVTVFVYLRTTHWVSSHGDYLSGRLSKPPERVVQLTCL